MPATKNGKPTNRIAKVSLFGELGVSGIQHYSGYINEEFLRELQGDRAIQVYKEMWHNSAILGAAIRAISLLARQVDWRVEGAEPGAPVSPDSEERTEEADPRATFIEECLHDMSTDFQDVVAEAVTGEIVFGWSFHEEVYKKRQGPNTRPGLSSQYTDGRIGWRKFPTRSQDTRLRWEFDPQGGLKGMHQMSPSDGRQAFIPIEKALLFRLEQHKGNPEGLSMLRTAYRSWYFAKRIEEIEGIGIERELAGLPVMSVPAEITTSDAPSAMQAIYAECKKIVRNIRKDEQAGITLPMQYDEKGNPLYKLELLATGGERQINTNDVLQRYHMMMAMCLLADFLLLGHEKVGSFSLASNKTHLFSVALGTLLDSIACVFNRHAIPRILALNGMDMENPPQLKHGDIESPDMLELADTLLKLGQAGMMLFPDLKLENHIRREYRLPEKTQEEFDAAVERKDEEADAQLEALRAKATQGGPEPTTPKKE